MLHGRSRFEWICNRCVRFLTVYTLRNAIQIMRLRRSTMTISLSNDVVDQLDVMALIGRLNASERRAPWVTSHRGVMWYDATMCCHTWVIALRLLASKHHVVHGIFQRSETERKRFVDDLAVTAPCYVIESSVAISLGWQWRWHQVVTRRHDA